MTKTVWITGASSGIGREFARRYAAMGCRLILTARRADRLTALAEELNDAHGTVCRILPADLADRADCDRLCAELAGERIDIFINNAGFGVCGSLLETDSAKEEEMVQVNVAAMRRLFQFMLRRMQAQGGGTILNVASSAGLLPGGPYMAGYYASKAYVVSLTRGAAQELREKRRCSRSRASRRSSAWTRPSTACCTIRPSSYRRPLCGCAPRRRSCCPRLC